MYTHFTLNAMEAFLKIYTHNVNEPFYASDFNLTSGEINSLKDNRLIKETGNTRDGFVHLYDDIYKRVTVKEWIIVDEPSNWTLLVKDIHTIKEFINKFEI